MPIWALLFNIKLIKMKTELILVDPKEFGLEEKKANEMTSGLKSIIEERNSLEEIYNELIKQELNQDTLKQAKALRIKIRDNRTKGIEVWHKSNKAFYLAGGRFVDAVKNKEVVNNDRMEAKLEEIELYFINLEKEAKAKLKVERLTQLEPFEVLGLEHIAVEEMTEEQFASFLSTNKSAFEARKEQERLSELARIEAEKKAENERLAKIEADRLERVRIEEENANLKAEQERLAKEQEAKDKAAKIEADKLAKAAAEQKEIADKLAAELKAKADAEKLAAEQERQRIEAEEADKLAKEKAALLAPDKEKVKVFAIDFGKLVFPELSTKEGKEMAVRVNAEIEKLKAFINTEYKKMK